MIVTEANKGNEESRRDTAGVPVTAGALTPSGARKGTAHIITQAIDPAPDLQVCFGRVGLLEFGPFTLSELAELTSSHSLPDDLEVRIEDAGLWWSWPRIAAGAKNDATSPWGCFGSWFTRVNNSIAGPMTIADLSTLLLSGTVPPSVEVQIGDGPWRTVTDLLVPPEVAPPNAQLPVVAGPFQEIDTDGATADPTPTDLEHRKDPETSPLPSIPGRASQIKRVNHVGRGPNADNLRALPEPAQTVAVLQSDPAMIAKDKQKSELEAWLAKTMPQRTVAVVIAPRAPVQPLEDVIAVAMARVVARADDVGRQLSYPWIWGTFAALVLTSLYFLWQEPRGPDGLELTALRKLKSALEAIRAVRASKPDEAAWNAFGQSLQQDLEELKFELERTKRANTPIKESLYWALEYRLPRMLAEGRLQPSPSENGFQNNLREAERHLQPGAQ